MILPVGSIYCDRTLREGGFCGEGLRGSSLVAVKTHDSSLQWRGDTHVSDSSRPMFDKAIFLIRNPFRANIAEWNRQMSKKYASDQTGSSHVKYVSNKAFFGEISSCSLYEAVIILSHIHCMQARSQAGRLW